MSYKIGELIYEGKAKQIFAVVDHPELICMKYKNSLTAFNAVKKGEFTGKGRINQEISKIIFDELSKNKINTHLVEILDDQSSIVRKLKMIPLEVVVRNKIAGSLAKKFGIKEGAPLPEPLLEYYYKDDALGDPFITAEQAVALGFVDKAFNFTALAELTLKINKVLRDLYGKAQLELIDFKLEFGMNEKSEILLADEISPDSCRLWDKNTGEKMDKDRFRHDLGRVQESYEEVLNRLRKVRES